MHNALISDGIYHCNCEARCKKKRDKMKDAETLDTTVDEWRVEIGRMEDPPGSTIKELAEISGRGLTSTRNLMDRLYREKKVRKIRAIRTNEDGLRYGVSVYQLILKKEKK